MQIFGRTSALFALLSVLSLDAAATTHMQVSGDVDFDGDGVLDSSKGDFVDTLPFPTPTIQVSDVHVEIFDYYAEADIATPALRVAGGITSNDAITNLENGVLKVYAEMDDVITLNSTLADPYQVTVQMQVDGTLLGYGNDAVGSAWLQARPNDGLAPYVTHDYTTGGAVSAVIADVLSQTVTLDGATQTLGIFTKLMYEVHHLDPGGYAYGDFSHTAKLTLVLPEGVTLDGSQSGRFDTAPVPLPAGVLLFAPAALALFRGSRRRSV